MRICQNSKKKRLADNDDFADGDILLNVTSNHVLQFIQCDIIRWPEAKNCNYENMQSPNIDDNRDL